MPEELIGSYYHRLESGTVGKGANCAAGTEKLISIMMGVELDHVFNNAAMKKRCVIIHSFPH